MASNDKILTTLKESIMIAGEEMVDIDAVRQAFIDNQYEAIVHIMEEIINLGNETMHIKFYHILQVAKHFDARKLIRMLVESGVDLNCNLAFYECSISCAFLQSDCSLLNYIIECGFDINLSNSVFDFMSSPKEETPLLLQVLSILVESGANINIVNDVHYSPLFYAIGHRHVKACEHLVYRGADVHCTNGLGLSPLLWACHLMRFNFTNHLNNLKEIQQADARIVQALLIFGADRHQKDDKGWKPLLHAAEQRNLYLMKAILQHGYQYRPLLVERCIKATIATWDIDKCERLDFYKLLRRILKDSSPRNSTLST